MAVALVVVIDADVVLDETHASGSEVDVGQHRHVVIRRLGTVDALVRLQRTTERDGGSAANESAGGGDPVRGEVIESAALFPLAPAIPISDFFEECPEFFSAHIDATARRGHARSIRVPYALSELAILMDANTGMRLHAGEQQGAADRLGRRRRGRRYLFARLRALQQRRHDPRRRPRHADYGRIDALAPPTVSSASSGTSVLT
jgi:hypothetical protein